MRRALNPEPAGRTAPSRSVQEMKVEQADLARDAKKEGAMCASAACQRSHGLKQGPDGYRGRYGGHKLCAEHYRKIVDYIAKHGCLPSENDE